jgi:hypothetical protein
MFWVELILLAEEATQRAERKKKKKKKGINRHEQDNASEEMSFPI